ncbi:MAG: hypothetical protein HFG34_03135 [Eubacterium sp.]|nr:hypothetical protein [Eubacterium sp.]
MKKATVAVAKKQVLDADLLVAHLLEKLMRKGIINQATYHKAKGKVSIDGRK